MKERQNGLVAPGNTFTSALPTAASTALVFVVVYCCSALPYDELIPNSCRPGCRAASRMAKTSSCPELCQSKSGTTRLSVAHLCRRLAKLVSCHAWLT